MEKQTQYRAVIRDIAQVIVGKLVEETKTSITLERPAMMNVQAANGSVNLQFIPMELISINPVIFIKALLEDDKAEEPFVVTFQKSSLVKDDVPLKADIFDGYAKSLEPSVLAVPENVGGLVAPDGSPLNADVPKIHDLF